MSFWHFEYNHGVMKKLFIIINIIEAIIIIPALAHSGGLDSSGCHAGSRPYHCHRASSGIRIPSISTYKPQNSYTIPTPNSVEEAIIKKTWRNICNCPYNRKSNGHRCGKTSAWSRPGGNSPLCYVEELITVPSAVPPIILPTTPPETITPNLTKNEKYYSDLWCAKNKGDSNAVLSDLARPDCVLPDTVVEFDFGYGMKPYECAGQALHYASITNKKPLCILIKKKWISDKDYAHAVRKVHVPVKCMEENSKIVDCP